MKYFPEMFLKFNESFDCTKKYWFLHLSVVGCGGNTSQSRSPTSMARTLSLELLTAVSQVCPGRKTINIQQGASKVESGAVGQRRVSRHLSRMFWGNRAKRACGFCGPTREPGTENWKLCVVCPAWEHFTPTVEKHRFSLTHSNCICFWDAVQHFHTCM